MIRLTAEQAQQIEEALDELRYANNTDIAKTKYYKALATIRAARAQEQAEQDLDTCPGCGGVADNGHDREFPPNPYYCTKFSEQAEQEPTVSDGVCGGCAKKAADGWALYCVECWEKAEQPVSQEYQDHLVNQSFDWAAMAAKHQFMEGYRIGLAEMREKCAKVAERFEPDEKCSYVEYASAAIRAINFEGDTGFRPVSEMVAEHKQDPKKAAAIEKAKMRKAEQKPVAVISESAIGLVKLHSNGVSLPFDTPLYAAPVRTKDLADEEIQEVMMSIPPTGIGYFLRIARAVIAADRDKNRGS